VSVDLSLTFDEVDVPVGHKSGGRQKEENPYEALVLQMRRAVDEGGPLKARRVVVPHVDPETGRVVSEVNSEGQVSAVSKLVRQLRAVGNECHAADGEPAPFSVRMKTEPTQATVELNGDRVEVQATAVTFWIYTKVVDGRVVAARITREDTSASASEQEQAAAEDAG